MDEIKGAGHFSFWFIQGYFVFKLWVYAKPDWLQLRMYGPFIPFGMGFISIVPYLLVTLGVITRGEVMNVGYNVFLLYGLINSVELLVKVFSNFHLAIVLTGAVYVGLVFHYIKLVKSLRSIYAE